VLTADDDELHLGGWIGWDDFGAIERADGESVVTRFWSIVIPLWPGHSVYVTREQRIKIALQRRSVVLGYLRAPVWLAALVLAVPGVVDFARWGHFLVLGAVLAALAALSQFAAGRLGAAERERRALLRRVVGFGAPPELLPPAMLAHLQFDLEQRWAAHSRLHWPDAITGGTASELLVALADYHQREDLLAIARGNLDDQTIN
jgi:hypothetical protein